jgi:2'-5' RNA ligase
VAEEIDGLRRALGDRSLGRVPPHVTLVPPVNVAQADLGVALAVLRRAAASIRSHLRVTLEAPATFLPANPVLYLPVAGDPGAVHGLRERVWYPPLTRSLTWPFVPHVTLADDADPERIGWAMAALADYRATVTFDRVHLLVERRPGPRWRPFADAAFGPPAVVARGSPLALELSRSRQIDPEALALLEAEGVERAEGDEGIGIEGVSGVTGFDGVSGVTGLEGVEWAGTGISGVTGVTGVTGLEGVERVEGDEGTGIEVVTGVTGFDGVSGVTGFEGLVPELALPAPLVVTARRQGEVVGVAATWMTEAGRRSAVFVAPAHRHQGIGRHLEAALEAAVNDAIGADD